MPENRRQTSLFEKAPLASRLRPQNLDDIIGQKHLLGEAGSVRAILKQDPLPSLILWGPAGCGKTTLANLLIKQTKRPSESLSAVDSGVASLRNVFARAETQGTICLFVDEIHRFNRSQQDSFLPYVERGTIILVGATTENPSFVLNSPLLSRCRVIVLQRLTNEDLHDIVRRAETYVGSPLPLDDQALEDLLAMADGDARYLINNIETLYSLNLQAHPLDRQALNKLLQTRAPFYDANRDEHYNLISALHKSLRGSDCDAALYYLYRMLNAGEDPNYVARRMLRFAWEDIGLADPNAAQVAMNAWQTYERLGSPEGEIALAALAVYLSFAPKSNATYKASKQARAFAKAYGSLMPPQHILNAPTHLMKDLGYGHDYTYDHDVEDAFSGDNYFPDDVERPAFYEPVNRGLERELVKRANWFKQKRDEKLTKQSS